MFSFVVNANAQNPFFTDKTNIALYRANCFFSVKDDNPSIELYSNKMVMKATKFGKHYMVVRPNLNRYNVNKEALQEFLVKKFPHKKFKWKNSVLYEK